jgi:hypothetical protein
MTENSQSPVRKHQVMDNEISPSFWHYLQRRSKIDPSSEGIISQDHLYSMRPYKDQDAPARKSVRLFYLNKDLNEIIDEKGKNKSFEI